MQTNSSRIPWSMLIKSCVLCVSLLWCTAVVAADQTGTEIMPKSLKIGDKLPDFTLQDFQGRNISSKEVTGGPLVVFFFGVECPLVKQYALRLNEIAKKYDSEKLTWIGIDSNRHDSLKEIEHFAHVTGLKLPLVKDPGNRVADAFGAQRTPEVFLFDADRVLRYHGAIDDQHTYGKQKTIASNHYLVDAIEAVSNGKAPAISNTAIVGCIIGRMKKIDSASSITYSNQISRILQTRCVSCHRTGEVAPFSLTEYAEVVGWAEMIQEVVQERRMPPWHANPKHGDFKNDASLSQQEIRMIEQWVAAGAPQGDSTDLPEPIEFTEGWQIGQPDVVIPMSKKPYQVPATGVVPYEYFVVDPGFKEDKWVQAAECRIGNRAVVHHIIVAVHDDDDRPVHGQVQSEWITATAPGARPLVLPEGFAKLIPAGSKLLFQMHYTPNGTPQTDLSSVGFKFVDPNTVRKTVGTRQAINESFRIPPGADNHKVTARFRFRKDSLMLSLFPHMHLRGKSFRYIAKYPDGTREILLDVPNYDFNWQNGYEFKQPKLIPAKTVLECVAHFDNSENNFANPDPTKTVRWGDQTWDEMMIGYFDMALADQDLTSEMGD